MASLQPLIEKWEQVSEKFNQRILRERVLILGCALAVLYLLWDFTISQPMAKERGVLEERFKVAKSALVQISAEEQVLVKALTNDASADKKREVVRLQNQLEALEKNLQALSVGLLPAEKLPKVLHDVLQKSSQLKMLGLQKKEIEELVLENAAATTNNEETDKAIASAKGGEPQPVKMEMMLGVYKHSVTVALEGTFFEIQAYLKGLEELPWTFYWNSLDYRVTQYPRAEVQLEVYTLSTDKGVIGG